MRDFDLFKSNVKYKNITALQIIANLTKPSQFSSALIIVFFCSQSDSFRILSFGFLLIFRCSERIKTLKDENKCGG